MAATAAAKQNITAQGYSYYSSIPRELCAVSGLTMSAVLLGGFLASFSGKEDENGNVKPFNGKRGDLLNYIGGSLASISRSMTKLKDADYVERKGMSSYAFKQDKLTNDKTWNLPLELNTRIFEIKAKNGSVKYRTLTRGERLTYSYFYTKLATVTHKTTIEAVYARIAEELGIDPTTVSAAVQTLSGLKLLYCPEDWIGVNGHRKGKVGLVKRWGWFRKETQYRSKKNKKKKVSEKEAQSEQTAANRDNYFKDLQAAARQKAFDALDAARSYEQFRTLDDERKDVSALLRRAFISNNKGYAEELSAQKKKLDDKCRTVLENLGFDPDSLKPEHYAVCKRCNDTGWLKDGKPCDCFRTQGSPPKNGKRTRARLRL